LAPLARSLAEREGRDVQLVHAFHRSQCDRQVLNREPCRVEHGHFVLASASLGVAGEDRAELGNVFAFESPSLQRVDELPVVARLLEGLYKRNILIAVR